MCVTLTIKLFFANLLSLQEICCSLGEADGTGRGWSGGYDPTIANALMWSGMVYQSILVAGEAHYDFWTLVSGGIGCDPLDDASCVTTPNADGWTVWLTE